MLMPMRIITVLFLLMFSNISARAQQTFYNLNNLQKIEIQFAQSNWDYLLDTLKSGSGKYLMCSWVKVNGVQFDSVGIKYKGSSSYDSTYAKNPFHIRLDKYKNHQYQGYRDIKLSNIYSDPSMLREPLAYSILQNYMHCPKANYAMVYVNGVYLGLFVNDEPIDEHFCGDHFYSAGNTLIKGNPVLSAGPTVRSPLKYIDADSSSYFNYYGIQSKYGWHELVDLCDTITNSPSDVSTVLDVDRACWMLAFNNVMVNLDSYSGWFAQNHYSYRDDTRHFNPIVWDLNMALGGFAWTGLQGGGSGVLNVTSMQQLSPLLHANDSDWPLIKDIVNEPMYKRMYIAHMRTITNEYFANNMFQTLATNLQSLIDTAVQADTNKFYSYSDFQNGLTANVTVGSHVVPGIATLMTARNTYLQSTAEFSATPPIISNVLPSSTSPAINSSITITASVTNTNISSVYLGYRDSKKKKFTRVIMFDDGAHNDGASGDNVYGTFLFISSGQMQYYIYAENNNAGMFSPERAEHEFYTLNATAVIPQVGQLVINEFLCNNNNKEKDEYNERADWIELYNNSNVLLNLAGLNLSDDKLSLQKWSFPAGTTLNPYSYLIVWADNDSTQKDYHAYFNLNKDSGTVVLSSSISGVLDSISYSQQSPDVSFGRYPNGTGTFQKMNTTFAAQNNNYTLAVNEIYPKKPLILYPNPVAHTLNLEDVSLSDNIIVLNELGQKITVPIQHQDNKTLINVSCLPAGIYQINCITMSGDFQAAQFVKQ